MESNDDVEVQNELSFDETTTSSCTTICPEDLQNFNTNCVTGFIGIMAGLGIIAGILAGIILKDIFRK